MVLDHWSNDAMVSMDRRGLLSVLKIRLFCTSVGIGAGQDGDVTDSLGLAIMANKLGLETAFDHLSHIEFIFTVVVET